MSECDIHRIATLRAWDSTYRIDVLQDQDFDAKRILKLQNISPVNTGSTTPGGLNSIRRETHLGGLANILALLVGMANG